jgi:hypothetical protein
MGVQEAGVAAAEAVLAKGMGERWQEQERPAKVLLVVQEPMVEMCLILVPLLVPVAAAVAEQVQLVKPEAQTREAMAEQENPPLGDHSAVAVAVVVGQRVRPVAQGAV